MNQEEEKNDGHKKRLEATRQQLSGLALQGIQSDQKDKKNDEDSSDQGIQFDQKDEAGDEDSDENLSDYRRDAIDMAKSVVKLTLIAGCSSNHQPQVQIIRQRSNSFSHTATTPYGKTRRTYQFYMAEPPTPAFKEAINGLKSEIDRLVSKEKGYDITPMEIQLFQKGGLRNGFNKTGKIKKVAIERSLALQELYDRITDTNKKPLSSDQLLNELEKLKNKMKSTGRHFDCLRCGTFFGGLPIIGITGQRNLQKLIENVKKQVKKEKKISLLSRT